MFISKKAKNRSETRDEEKRSKKKSRDTLLIKTRDTGVRS
jgi:hypothetical protein